MATPTIAIEGVTLTKRVLDEIDSMRNSEHLSGNPLMLFQRLHIAYGRKDAEGVNSILAESYTGSLYGCASRDELFDMFDDMFAELPFFMKPKLKIIVHQIAPVADDQFQGVIEFESRMTIIGIPMKKFGSGQVKCTAAPVGANSRWVITSLEPVS